MFDYKQLSFLLGTQSRDRTGMEVNPLVFETSASTNSAIWAFLINLLALAVGLFLKCVAKVQLFFKPASVWVKIFKYFFSQREYVWDCFA